MKWRSLIFESPIVLLSCREGASSSQSYLSGVLDSSSAGGAGCPAPQGQPPPIGPSAGLSGWGHHIRHALGAPEPIDSAFQFRRRGMIVSAAGGRLPSMLRGSMAVQCRRLASMATALQLRDRPQDCHGPRNCQQPCPWPQLRMKLNARAALRLGNAAAARASN